MYEPNRGTLSLWEGNGFLRMKLLRLGGHKYQCLSTAGISQEYNFNKPSGSQSKVDMNRKQNCGPAGG